MESIHDYNGRRERAVERVHESSPLCDSDKKLIFEFINHKIARGIGVAREVKYLTILRDLGEKYISSPFSSLEKRDVEAIVSTIERSEFSGWTKRDYKFFLKTFLAWMGKHEEVDWIRLKKPKRLPDDILAEKEILAMIDAAENLRDKALIAMLYEGGFRIGELGTMALKDVSFDRYGALAMVDGKTGMRRVRLIWSMPYIAQWLEMHPRREERDAPLWIKMSNSEEALKYDAIRMQLQKIAKRAGVHKRVNPHNFRHSRSTHLASKLTESQMEEYLGWVQGSKMPSIYVHMSGRDLDADLLRMYGIEPEKEDQKEELETLQCPHCKTLNTIGARICVNCRKPLAVEEVMDREEKAMKIFGDFVDLAAENPKFMEGLNKHFGVNKINKD
jgi:site-specific recombinase XerD